MASGNKDYAPDITFPLTIEQGGTGLTTLTAGALLVGEGTGPVGLTLSPSVTNLSSHPTASTFGISISGNSTAPVSPALSLFDDTGNLTRGQLALASQAANYFSNALAGDIILQANTGNLLLGTVGVEALAIGITQLVTLAHPLAVASGGTGQNSLNPLALATLDVTPTVNASGIKLHGNTTTPVTPVLFLWDDTGAVSRGVLLVAESADQGLTGAVTGDIVLRADTGTLRLGTVSLEALAIDQSQLLTIDKTVKSYNGVALPSPGLPSIVATVDRTGLTAAQANVLMYTTPAAGFYRIHFALYMVGGAISDSAFVQVAFTQNGVGAVLQSPSVTVLAGGTNVLSYSADLYVDAAKGIVYTYNTTTTLPASADLHIRLEAL